MLGSIELGGRGVSRAWVVLAIFALACGDDAAPVDGGVPDGGPDAMVDSALDAMPTMDAMVEPDVVYACEDNVIAESAVSVTLTLDTEATTVLPRDLGFECGNIEAMRWAPQEVVEYLVPGTGSMQVTASLLNAGTPTSFDTLLQVRRGRCQGIPGSFPPSCFDDAGSDARSEAVVSAEGGDTLYILVTGYAETPFEGFVDRGSAELTITAVAHSRPVITAAEAYFAGTDAIFDIHGTDMDGDAAGAFVTLLDGAGEQVGSELAAFFDADLSTMTTFTGRARFASAATDAADAETARVVAFDSAFGLSDSVDVAIGTLPTVGYGEPCDLDTVCRSAFTCTVGACSASAEIEALCDGATAITVAAPTDTTTRGAATASLGPGVGLLSSDCAAAQGFAGTEGVFSVDVPAGAYDIIARTTRPADTILYTRTTCADLESQLGCSDDIDAAAGNALSRLEHRDVSEGTYYFVVEVYGGFGEGTMSVGLEVSLRPVLGSGATCDMAEADDRCAAGSCSGGTCP